MSFKTMEGLENFFVSEMKKFESRLDVGAESDNSSVLAREFNAFKQLVLSLLGKLKIEISALNEKTDDQENYTRRNCLLIHGIKELKDEDTDKQVIDFCKDNLGINLTLQDLERTHRLGKPRTDKTKNRPIIAKFSSYRTRNNIFINKKKLKGKATMITESLSKQRADLYKKTRDVFEKSCWTRDSTIFAKVGTEIITIRRESDIHEALQKTNNTNRTLRPRPRNDSYDRNKKQ